VRVGIYARRVASEPTAESAGARWRPGDPHTRDWARRETSEWFWSHYGEAADAIVEFLGGDGISLEGKDIADVGCGDGIIDLGLVHKARPGRLVGFDIAPETEDLLERARAEGVATDLPTNLAFVRSEPTKIPADDDSFDFVVTWSTFEHVENPVALLREIRRILRPTGVLFLQLWPFYHSEHGAHLWHWYDGGFIHLRRRTEELAAEIRAGDRERHRVERGLEEVATLNKITLEGLQRALWRARFTIAKVELMTETFHLPPELRKKPLARLGVAGIKLLAFPRASLVARARGRIMRRAQATRST
jgi:SAM-dependent methyltransferase